MSDLAEGIWLIEDNHKDEMEDDNQGITSVVEKVRNVAAIKRAIVFLDS